MNLFRKYKTIEELQHGFLFQKETRVNEKTHGIYMCHIRVLDEYLKSIGFNQPMKKITPDHIMNFFHHIYKNKDLDRSTCEKYFIHLNLFFAYAQSLGEIDSVPFNRIVLPKQKRDHSADVITQEDLKLLLPEMKKTDPQLYLACMIIYYCFIRPGKELRLLKIHDIDLNYGIITVRQENAKNGHQQSVTMPKQLIDICKEYEIDKADKTLYVFGTKKKFGTKPNSLNMLSWRFNKVRDRLNLSKRYKLYSMKHTGASRAHNSGVPIRELMDQLRHSKLEATGHYIKRHIGTVSQLIRDNFPSPI